MDSRDLCIYIERLRSSRKVSQEYLTDGLVSLRQYRRYLNGESDIPFDIFINMVEKMGLRTDTVLKEMETIRFEEYQYSNSLFNYAIKYEYEKFDKLIKDKNLDHFVDPNNKLLYELALILKDYYQNRRSKKHIYAELCEILDYPKILKHEMITEIELLVLSNLVDVSQKTTQKKIIDRIFYFYKHENSIIGGWNNRTVLFILAKFAKYYGIEEDYQNVIDFCDVGIKRNTATRSYYLSEFFYYYKALAYHILGDHDKFIDSLKKCFNVLELDSNLNMKNFEYLIKDDFGFSFREKVIQIYQEELANKKSK